MVLPAVVIFFALFSDAIAAGLVSQGCAGLRDRITQKKRARRSPRVNLRILVRGKITERENADSLSEPCKISPAV
jgi:hypothetical protein